MPEFGSADEKWPWSIEGHDVDPDIVIEEDPLQGLAGRYAQRERGVAELLKLLPSTSTALPNRPVDPVKIETR